MSKLGCVTWLAVAILASGCGEGGDAAKDVGTAKADLAAPQPDSGTGGGDTSTPGTDSATPGADVGLQQDQGTDARVRDPRITSDPDPDEVACGKVTCYPSKGEVCCVSMFGMSCKPASGCIGLAAPAACDGPEDCPGGQHCCVGFPSGATCSAAACAGQSQELCNYNEDCATQQCTPCKGPGSSLVYGLCTTDTSCPSPYTSP